MITLENEVFDELCDAASTACGILKNVLYMESCIVEQYAGMTQADIRISADRLAEALKAAKLWTPEEWLDDILNRAQIPGGLLRNVLSDVEIAAIEAGRDALRRSPK